MTSDGLTWPRVIRCRNGVRSWGSSSGEKESMFYRFVTIFSFRHERQISFSIRTEYSSWLVGLTEFEKKMFCLINGEKKKKKNKDKYRRYIN